MRIIRNEFEGVWGPADTLLCVQVPGRVNLIGDHTDYNEGYVLPMTIDRDVIIAGHLNHRRFARVYSCDMSSRAEFHTKRLDPSGLPFWARYATGAARRVVSTAGDIPGFDAVIHSTLPIGASLSSSAAFSIANALFMATIAGITLSRKSVALGCQEVEHKDIGVRCGLMDQMVILYARTAHALFIDCRSLLYEWIPFRLGEHELCVIDTGVKHELAATSYNQRRSECQEAAKILSRNVPGLRSLRDISVEELAQHSSSLPNALMKRARHVVTENKRVLDSVQALRRGDLPAFGRLMNASHDSLRDDYEVSGPELDTIVEAARSVEGTVGARLTGAGFGGCTVNIVRSDAVTSFVETVSETYAESFGRTPKIYDAKPVKGARIFEDRADGTRAEFAGYE